MAACVFFVFFEILEAHTICNLHHSNTNDYSIGMGSLKAWSWMRKEGFGKKQRNS